MNATQKLFHIKAIRFKRDIIINFDDGFNVSVTKHSIPNAWNRWKNNKNSSIIRRWIFSFLRPFDTEIRVFLRISILKLSVILMNYLTWIEHFRQKYWTDSMIRSNVIAWDIFNNFGNFTSSSSIKSYKITYPSSKVTRKLILVLINCQNEPFHLQLSEISIKINRIKGRNEFFIFLM